jgi:two-component system, cell cycle response regulator DivK
MSIPDLQNKKLLVVEDDDMSYLYLNQLLLLSKGTYIREKTGIDAIQRFRNQNDFDLVLMDIQLPDMDGKQVTREIRSINSRIPIIAQTASRSAAEQVQILEAGCTAVLMKPFSMDDFFQIITTHLNARQ